MEMANVIQCQKYCTNTQVKHALHFGRRSDGGENCHTTMRRTSAKEVWVRKKGSPNDGHFLSLGSNEPNDETESPRIRLTCVMQRAFECIRPRREKNCCRRFVDCFYWRGTFASSAP